MSSTVSPLESPSLTENIEDFNGQTPQRKELLDALKAAIGFRDVDVHFWAMCQICDLEKLREMANHPTRVSVIEYQPRALIKHWMQKNPYGPVELTDGSMASQQQRLTSGLRKQVNSLTDPAQAAATGSSAESSLYRNKVVRQRAFDRDGGVCVIDGSTYPQVAHIYPFYSLRPKSDAIMEARTVFWSFLFTFWSEEKVQTWMQQLFPDGVRNDGKESLHNLICLSPSSHDKWNKGAFALKPLAALEGEDNKTLRLQFFWQAQHDIIAKDKTEIDLCATALSTSQLTANSTFHFALLQKWETSPASLLQSGDIITLTTKDPEGQPLPSREILELQWYLQRISGMAGAARSYEIAVTSDSENSAWGAFADIKPMDTHQRILDWNNDLKADNQEEAFGAVSIVV